MKHAGSSGSWQVRADEDGYGGALDNGRVGGEVERGWRKEEAVGPTSRKSKLIFSYGI